MSRSANPQPPALAEAGGVVLAPLPFAPLRVLCADDNQDAADSLGTLLRLTGFVTEVCYDGPTALERAGRFAPEACVLDVAMPGMDGCELAAALRAADGGRKLFLVAVTAHGDAATAGRVADAGFDLHLVKPVAPQRLLDVLFEFERRTRGADAPRR
jgi:CheY-like chemotaxis protein